MLSQYCVTDKNPKIYFEDRHRIAEINIIYFEDFERSVYLEFRILEQDNWL